MEIELSIIIVNYNGEAFLADCLDSIDKQCKGLEYEVVIVDNASQDDSIALIESQYSNVKLYKSSLNLGFAGGNNFGVKKSTGKYLLLLNNDTILLDNFQSSIEQIKNGDVGIVGAQMKGKNGEYRRSAGIFPKTWTLLKLEWLFEKKNGLRNGEFGNKEQPIQVDWIEGSFLLTKRDIWNSVKGLDEEYFMYVEDVDYCKKVSLIGKKCLYLPDTSYIHFGGYNNSRTAYLKKGFHRYIKKFHSKNKIFFQTSLNLNFLIKDFKKTFRTFS